MVTNILPEMVPMRDIKQIGLGDRLFYELGRYVGINYWVLSGQFKEIQDVESMLKHDDRMTSPDYLNHHNFMLIKKTKH